MSMKRNIKILATLIFIAIIIAVSTISLADNYSASIALTSDSKLKEGETVSVVLKLTALNADGNGINVLTANIDYDKDVFEELTEDDFDSGSSKFQASYAPVNGNVVISSSSLTGTTAPSTLMTINFKVKSSISVDKTTITFKAKTGDDTVIVSGGNTGGDIAVSNASVTISRDQEATSTTIEDTPTGSGSDVSTGTGTGTSTSTGNTSSSKTNTKSDTTTSTSSTLPKTGLAMYGTIAILVVAIMGLTSYVLYKKTSKYVK